MDGTDKSCADAAKDLSNQEETTRMGQAGPVSRKGTDVSAPEPQSISAPWVVRTAARNKEAEKLYQGLGSGGLSVIRRRPSKSRLG